MPTPQAAAINARSESLRPTVPTNAKTDDHPNGYCSNWGTFRTAHRLIVIDDWHCYLTRPETGAKWTIKCQWYE